MSIKWGLLWYDDTKDTLEVKVRRAAERYVEKYGVEPDACFVHPSELGTVDEANLPSCKVVANPTVLEHHFWIGESVK